MDSDCHFLHYAFIGIIQWLIVSERDDTAWIGVGRALVYYISCNVAPNLIQGVRVMLDHLIAID